MDFGKGLDGQVNKVIDQAAGVAKQKINSVIGGAGGAGGAGGDKKKEGGIGDKVSGAINKAASDAVVDTATKKAMDFGKNLMG